MPSGCAVSVSGFGDQGCRPAALRRSGPLSILFLCLMRVLGAPPNAVETDETVHWESGSGTKPQPLRSASSSNFVTVFQLRLVTVTPRRLSDKAPASLEPWRPCRNQA
jgi:hypothetical protein